MKLLASHSKRSHTAAIVALEDRFPFLLTARSAAIARMSGHPVALHSIGRLQQSFKFESYESLLNSLLKVQNLAYLTAEVIDTMEATKVERFQMDRTQIAAYVQNITSARGNSIESADDIDIIAHLITSFEANSSAWMLQGDTVSADLHQQMHALYKEVLGSTDFSIPVYDPHKGEVVSFDKLKHIADLLTKSEEGEGVSADAIAASTLAKHEVVKYRLACVRVLDHIYQLMTDRDVWYQFVPPRLKAEVATSLERGKGLRVLSLYCQSLLNYYQYFMVEMFMASYELVQKWIIHFPPLPPRATQLLETLIRKHDLFNAKGDVQHLVDSLYVGDSLASMLFPREFTSPVGLTQYLDEKSAIAAKYTFNGTVADLAELDSPKYLPLITDVAAGALDITYKVSTLLATGEEVAGFIARAVSAIMPSIAGANSDLTIERFKRVGFNATLPFVLPTATSWEVERGADQRAENNKLFLDSAAPQFSFDYHLFIRNNLRLKLSTDRAVSKTYLDFQVRMIPDYDRASELSELLGHSYRSLHPAQLHNGDKYYDYDTLAASPQTITSLIETLTGVSYESIIRIARLDHSRQMLATFLSSFSLLYVSQASDAGELDERKSLRPDTVAVKRGDLPKLALVPGLGKPYGITYETLAAKQGPENEEDPLLNLGGGLYLKLLTKVPLVVNDLKTDDNFYLQHPFKFFASNSELMTVDKWVLGKGLLNFTYIPVLNPATVPELVLSSRYAYLTHRLYVSTDLYFKPAAPAESREVITLNVVEAPWKDERRYFFLKYTHFGPYTQAAVSAVSEVLPSTVDEAMKKIEEAIVKDEKEQVAATDSVGSATERITKTVASDVADVSHEMTTRHNLHSDREHRNEL